MEMAESYSVNEAEAGDQGEISLLLETFYAHHGYDFRQYSRASITRRIFTFASKHRIKNISDITKRARHDLMFFNLFISEIPVTVTEMFRRPSLFHLIRKKLLPTLSEHSTLKIWAAGCATGEEAYSLAILLHESGLLARTQIYATDINPLSLETASKGIIPTADLKISTLNYRQSGGQGDFCDYYKVREDVGFMESFLKKRILFTPHNLVHDQVFGEMDVIFCRNVMIYFTPELQKKVFELFINSLKEDGVLCLGSNENMRFSGFEHHFHIIEEGEKLYKRKATATGQGELHVA